MPFKTVALIGKPEHKATSLSVHILIDYLTRKGCQILLEQKLAGSLTQLNLESADYDGIGQQADLAIVVGGDGHMLGAARALSRFDIAVVGINRGNLGFLTDIHPDEICSQLDLLFDQQSLIELRFLLEVEVIRSQQVKSTNTAVNEVVLHHSKVAHMMEFEVYVDEDFAFSQRSDGLIVATPTGSTAYSLSGGGPILTPNLDALSLVPMFPHTLSSRPIVIDANSNIRIKVSPQNTENLQISCDSHVVLNVEPGDEITISKCAHKLALIHPKSYNYFHVLRNKLSWGSKLY